MIENKHDIIDKLNSFNQRYHLVPFRSYFLLVTFKYRMSTAGIFLCRGNT